MKIRMTVVNAVACLLLTACSTMGGRMMEVAGKEARYDVVIRNGRVLDGAGNPWIAADIAITDGRIAKVGLVSEDGAKVIDAKGKYVSPGWIDAMDQSGAVLLKNGLAENKLLMGVTTAIAGEGGTPVSATEIGQYFRDLEKQGISLNFATYYSATQARVEVIGESARRPTHEEMARIKDNAVTAMRGGALGLATALIYPPGAYQSTEELIEIAKASAPYGGIYATHMRDEGRDLVEAVNEAIKIGEQAGVKVEIFHLKAAYQPGWGELMDEAGRTIDAARARGIDVAADVYPYVAGGTGLEITLPLEVFEGGAETAIENLKDTSYRQNLISRIENREFGEWSDTNLVVAAGGWEGVVLANAHQAPYDQYHNQSIADIARGLDRNPYDVAIDIMLNAWPERAVAFYFMMSEDDVRTAMKFPWTSIGSDASAAEAFGKVDGLGLPHPRSYGTFPRIIAKYVREENVLSLEDAIRKMTSWPATRHGIGDRGVVKEGMWADLVVFDYDDIKDNATWENGVAIPDGIEYVIVNGVITVENGKHTGAKAGQVLLGPGAR